MQVPDLALPSLFPRYDAALRAAMEFVFAELEPFAVVVSGSIVRGNPDPSSDFDILVFHEQSWRRRIQKRFEGVPAEIFVNSTTWFEGYLAEEALQGRPVMAHMLTTGVVVFSSSAMTDELIENARESLQTGPQFSAAALERQRYSAACLFEDALEIAGRDAASATLILGRAVDAAIAFWFASRQQFAIRPKEQLRSIRVEAPQTADLIERALLDADMEARMEAARLLAEMVIGHTGFFEWDSGKDEPPVSPSSR